MSDSSTLREVFIDSDIETDMGTFSTNSPLTSNFDRRTRFVNKRYHLVIRKSYKISCKVSDFRVIQEYQTFFAAVVQRQVMDRTEVV